MKIFGWLRYKTPDRMIEAYIQKQPQRYWEQLRLSHRAVKELITVGQSNDHQTLYSLLDKILALPTREKYMIAVVLNRFVEIVREAGTKQEKKVIKKLTLHSAYRTLLEEYKSFNQPCSQVEDHQRVGQTAIDSYAN